MPFLRIFLGVAPSVAPWAARLSLALVLVFPALGAPVVLNELVSANQRGLEDEDTDRPDWIELHNPNPTAVSLAGYGLSDDPVHPFKWTFPPVVIAPRGFLVVFASGKNRTNAAAPLHASFAIAASGESLQLTAPDGSPIDAFPARPAPPDTALGRFPDGSGEVVFLPHPTPRQKNSGPGFAEFAAPPEFSIAAGLAPNPASVSILSTDPDVSTTLRFASDGSPPSLESLPWTQPFEIQSRSGDPNVLSLFRGTAIANQHTDGWFPPKGLVPKASFARALATRPNAWPSPIATRTWFVGNDSPFRFGLPVLSLVTDTNGLFDYSRGIYVLGKIFDDYRKSHPNEPLTGHTPANYHGRGPDWERDAHLEYFNADGSLAFQRDVTLDIQGQSSRSFRQKSLGVKILGPAISESLFPDWPSPATGQPLQEFKRFRLSNSGNDWDLTLFRDALCHALLRGLPIDTLAYRPVLVYLNGEFWGIHNLREQQDGRWIESHYGFPRHEIALCSGDATLLEGKPGDESRFRQLRDFAASQDLSQPAAAQRLESEIDVENFLLYHAAEIYFANADWPHNNIRYWRWRPGSPTPGTPSGYDGRWRWMLFDVDLGFGHPWSGGASENTLALVTSPNGRPGANAPWSTTLLRRILAVPKYQRLYLNTVADLLNTHFRENHVLSLIDQFESRLAPAMPAHIDRWRTQSGSPTTWSNHVRVLRNFATQRPGALRLHAVSQFRLQGYAPLTLDIDPPQGGSIQINATRLSSATPGATPASPYPWRGTYFQNVPVRLEAHPAVGWSFAGWDSSDTPLANPLQLSLQGPTRLTARFEPIPLRITQAALNAEGQFEIQCIGIPSQRYQIQITSDLRQWSLGPLFITDDDGAATVLLPVPPTPLHRFFRIVRR